MHPCDSAPPEHEESPEDDEEYEREMYEHDGVGEHVVVIPCSGRARADSARLTIG